MEEKRNNEESNDQVIKWLGGGYWLGQVNYIAQEGWGYITVYDDDKVLTTPDNIIVDKAWFSLKNSLEDIQLEDWVVFEPEDAPVHEKEKHYDTFRMQAKKGSVLLVKEIPEFKRMLPDVIRELDKNLSDNYIDSLKVFGERLFLVSRYAEKIMGKAEERARFTYNKLKNELESKMSEREIELNETIKNFEAQRKRKTEELESKENEVNAMLKKASVLEDKLKVLEEEKAIIQLYEEEINRKLTTWGLNPRSKQNSLEEKKISFFSSEKELIEKVDKHISARGYYFSREQLLNFYTSLKTGSIIILAGLSGTGKSSLVREFAMAISAEFVLVPVKATWSDDSDLLGFYHPEKKYYVSTVFLDTIIRANANPDRMFFICLDEMNLSRVEYYFSDFLSILEQKEDRKIHPYSKTEWDVRRAILKKMENQLELKEISQEEYDEFERNVHCFKDEIDVPNNIFICGTVNVDETTHPFSDKVLDRAQIIQYEKVTFDDYEKSDEEVFPVFLSFDKFQEYSRKTTEITIDNKWFNEINKILSFGGFHFGFRVKQQIEDYCGYAIRSGLFLSKDVDDIVDLQINQKILPKIRGINSPGIQERFFEKLLEFCGERYPKSRKIVEKLKNMDSMNYWQVFRNVN